MAENAIEVIGLPAIRETLQGRIVCGYAHTVGLRSDGTVVAAGYNGDGRCNVANWKLFDNFENL